MVYLKHRPTSYLLRRWVLALLVLVLLHPLWGQSASNRRIMEHRVLSGETVYSIARRYGLQMEQIYTLNPWAKERIKEGDILLLMRKDLDKSKASESQDTSKMREHTIAPGQTVYGVSRAYGISEEQLIKANPGISVDHFPVGMVLRIPASEGATPIADDERVRPAVRVLLMLPLTDTPRHVEFYQGFLMGMLDLKKAGISIRLKVLDVKTEAEMAEQIALGQLADHYDLVIGGTSDGEVEMIRRAIKVGYHIIPFSSSEQLGHARSIRLNQTGQEVADRVIANLSRLYQDRPIYIAARPGDSEDYFARQLRQRWQEEGRRVAPFTLGEHRLSSLPADALIIPANPDKTLGELLLSSMGDQRRDVLAYPQWQSYGEAFLNRMHQREVSIYSSFFFDTSSAEARQFLTKFNAWYSKKLMNTFPRYGVLGYDVARYFIRSYASLGDSFVSQGEWLAGDGLQLNIDLRPQGQGRGYVNKSVFIIKFAPDGTALRQVLN